MYIRGEGGEGERVTEEGMWGEGERQRDGAGGKGHGKGEEMGKGTQGRECKGTEKESGRGKSEGDR